MAVILLSVSQISAQQVLPGGTVVTDASVTRYRDSVRIGLVMDLTDVRVESGRSVVIQPRYVGEDGRESAYLPPVEVMGRTRSLYLKRNPEAISMDKVYCRILKQRKEPQQVAYEVTLPYAEWMNRSRLQVVEDRCGCGKIDQGTLTELLRADLAFRPRLAYVVPQAEPVKTRELSGRSYLDFRVNRTDIDAEYRKNPVELRRILASIDTVRNDKDFTITSIGLCGYASPEGSYASNRRLAEGRTEALKKYVQSCYGFADTLFATASVPENWEGLRQYVAGSSLADRDGLLALIDSDRDPDVKERALRSSYPEAYATLLAECYPGLRRTDYRIDYTVRSFHVDEAKAVFRTRPQNLSLDEMFAVAQTYEPGSDDFKQVFDVAVRMYPDSEVANLNAACALLEQGLTEQAQPYLEKAGDSPQAANARGVSLLLQGRYDEALPLLEQALQGGIKQAEENRKILKNEE